MVAVPGRPERTVAGDGFMSFRRVEGATSWGHRRHQQMWFTHVTSSSILREKPEFSQLDKYVPRERDPTEIFVLRLHAQATSLRKPSEVRAGTELGEFMRKPRKVWFAAAAGGLTSTSILVAAPNASPAVEGPQLTIEQIAALPADEQAEILDPLRQIAAAVSEIGRVRATATYTGLRLNPTVGTVDVWVTERESATMLLADAQTRDPRIDLDRVRVHTAPYSKAELVAATERLNERADELPYEIVAISIPFDGVGLEVGVEDPGLVPTTGPGKGAVSAADAVDPASLAGVPTVVYQQSMPQVQSRQIDSPPLAGGSYYSSPANPNKPGDRGARGCTTGYSALRNYDNSPVMVTAAHCVRTGDDVLNAVGVKTGFTTNFDTNYDAAMFSVTAARPAMYKGAATTDATLPIVASGYSWVGDIVCNNGYTTVWDTGNAMCGIQVYSDWTQMSFGAVRYPGFTASGVMGRQVNGQRAGDGGDSGGPVYAASQGGIVMRGTVTGPGSEGINSLFWPEAPMQLQVLDAHLMT